MDWKRLAAQQAQQLLEKDEEVQQLHQRYGSVSKKAGELQILVIELQEKLERAEQIAESAHTEKDLQLKLEELQAEKTKQERCNSQKVAKLEDEVNTSHEHIDNLRLRCEELERKTKELKAQSETHVSNLTEQKAALHQAQQQAKTLQERCQHLTNQLHAEKNASPQRFSASLRSKLSDNDEDDTEPELDRLTWEPTADEAVPPRKATVVKRKSALPSCRPRTPSPSMSISCPADSRSKRRRYRIIDEDSDGETSSIASTSDADEGSRSEESEIDENEIQFLSSTQHFKPSAPKRQRIQADFSELSETPEFVFSAVTSYNSDDSPQGYTSEDLNDVAVELWEKIAMLNNLWEEAKETCWHEEFLTKDYRALQCVTNRLCREQEVDGATFGNGRTKWHKGLEGQFACKDCVGRGWPCFTYRDGEFWLLPMVEGDRTRKVEKEFEIRYWINERD